MFLDDLEETARGPALPEPWGKSTDFHKCIPACLPISKFCPLPSMVWVSPVSL